MPQLHSCKRMAVVAFSFSVVQLFAQEIFNAGMYQYEMRFSLFALFLKRIVVLQCQLLIQGWQFTCHEEGKRRE